MGELGALGLARGAAREEDGAEGLTGNGDGGDGGVGGCLGGDEGGVAGLLASAPVIGGAKAVTAKVEAAMPVMETGIGKGQQGGIMHWFKINTPLNDEAKAALEGLTRPDGTRPLLIAVTQLTSTDQEALEEDLLARINRLGIGPQGFGGRTTALGVNIETLPTHIAGLPVAVNINCHVTRHKTEVI